MKPEMIEPFLLIVIAIAIVAWIVHKTIEENQQSKLNDLVTPDELIQLPSDVKAILADKIPVRRRDVIDAQAKCDGESFAAKQKAALI